VVQLVNIIREEVYIIEYNNKFWDDQYRVKNYPRLIIKKGLMQGYIYTDYFKSFPKGLEIMNNMIKNDKIKVWILFPSFLFEGSLWYKWWLRSGSKCIIKAFIRLKLWKSSGSCVKKITYGQIMIWYN
jgi:hypothetical protein